MPIAQASQMTSSSKVLPFERSREWMKHRSENLGTWGQLGVENDGDWLNMILQPRGP